MKFDAGTVDFAGYAFCGLRNWGLGTVTNPHRLCKSRKSDDTTEDAANNLSAEGEQPRGFFLTDLQSLRSYLSNNVKISMIKGSFPFEDQELLVYLS